LLFESIFTELLSQFCHNVIDSFELKKQDSILYAYEPVVYSIQKYNFFSRVLFRFWLERGKEETLFLLLFIRIPFFSVFPMNSHIFSFICLISVLTNKNAKSLSGISRPAMAEVSRYINRCMNETAKRTKILPRESFFLANSQCWNLS